MNTSQYVERPSSPRYPALDGLRAVAVIAVFFCHYGESWEATRQVPHSPTWFGWAGVDLFFVLSGFLITGILFDSLKNPHFFRNFYIRRALRIFPLFYGIWFLCLLVTPFLHVEWNRYVVAQMLYVGDLTVAGTAAGRHADPGVLVINGWTLIFGHFWTLCVEEQFYLLWPVIVFLVRDRVRLLRLSLAGAALILFGRCVFFEVQPTVASYSYYFSFTRFDTLLMGAAAALWLRGSPAPRSLSRNVYAWLFFSPLAVLGTGILVYLRTHPSRILETSTPVYTTVGFSLLGIACTGALLAALDERTVVSRLLRARPLMELGTISYGVYVFHSIPLRVLVRLHLLGVDAYPVAKWLTPLCAFPLVCAVAWLSYRYYESPFLRMKSRWAPSSPPRNVERALEAAVLPPEAPYPQPVV